MASIPQVALETAQPMLLMVLINAIVAHDNARVWAAVLGLVGLIPIYITGNFLFEYHGVTRRRLRQQRPADGRILAAAIALGRLPSRPDRAVTCCRASAQTWMRSNAAS